MALGNHFFKTENALFKIKLMKARGSSLSLEQNKRNCASRIGMQEDKAG